MVRLFWTRRPNGGQRYTPDLMHLYVDATLGM